MTSSTGKSCPKYHELLEPTFKALASLGGSGSNEEIHDKVVEMLNLPDSVVDAIIPTSATQRSYLDDRLSWARSYLKKYGAIDSTERKIWFITPKFATEKSINVQEVVQFVRSTIRPQKKDTRRATRLDGITATPLCSDTALPSVEAELGEPWKNELAKILSEMNPYAFERLAQLILRESGFSQVTVTRKSGDGGIDGTGKLRINGIFSFNVAFQCKRYAGSVSASEIRDFRGSLTTNIEKGVFITTGTFTKAARQDASEPGKKTIDLIDGDELVEKLIEFRMGVKEKTVFEVDQAYFMNVEKENSIQK